MSTIPSTYSPTCAAITVPDPDEQPFHYHVEEGGLLEIRSESRKYTNYAVTVTPNDPASKFSFQGSGSRKEPVVIEIPLESEGEYTITVMHSNLRYDTPPPPPYIFICSIHSCPGCTH